MAALGLAYGLAGLVGKKKKKRKASEGLDEMIARLQAQSGPALSQAQQEALRRQNDPMLQMLVGGGAPPQQSPIPTGQIDPKMQALINRAQTLKTGKGPVQAFDYLQQATDPATFAQRQLTESKSKDAALLTQQLQARDEAHKATLSQLGAGNGGDNMPAMLKQLTTPLGQSALSTQKPENAGAAVLGSMGVAGTGARIPSSVQEHRYYLNLNKEQREEYLRMKRAATIIDAGGGASSVVSADNKLKALTTASEVGANAATAKRLERIGIALGDEEGAERVGLGAAYGIAKRGVDTIDALRHHPGLTKATGVLALNPSKLVPGTDAHNFSVLLDQASGQVFASAYETLKGGGHITEFESESVAKGLARLKASQSQDEFKLALDDLETLILNIYAGQRRRAEGNFSAPADPQAEPSTITAGGRGRDRADVLKQYGVN